ncbi:MAG: dihydroneopterin aldolase [Chthoniobacterales bacterium]
MSDERDCIHIEQLEVLARVGVTENERTESQRLVFNVTAWPRESFATLHDDISETANYSSIAHEVRTIAANAEYKLIETLANNVAHRLLERFMIAKVRVEVRKFVLPGSAFVSVTAIRSLT